MQNFWGLPCDDVTDIFATEQFVCFAQFFSSECGVLNTDFLFVENMDQVTENLLDVSILTSTFFLSSLSWAKRFKEVV